MNKKSNIIIYEDGELKLDVSFNDETVWLSANDIASIFDVQRPAIVKHIGNIYKSNELIENSTCSILEQVAKDGKNRKINFYNLDMIISVGYRVNSIKATKFRQWATSVLKKYIQDGYVINSEKITHDRFISLENEVATLKGTVGYISTLIEDDNLKVKQGIFYNGTIFDAYIFLVNLVKSAKKSIVIIDNYIDDTVFTVLSKNQNIDIIIYTKPPSKQLKLDIKKYNEQYKNLTVKTTKTAHDRYFIIDDKKIFNIGASLKDIGKKTFSFNEMFLNIDELIRNQG